MQMGPREAFKAGFDKILRNIQAEVREFISYKKRLYANKLERIPQLGSCLIGFSLNQSLI